MLGRFSLSEEKRFTRDDRSHQRQQGLLPIPSSVVKRLSAEAARRRYASRQCAPALL